MIQKTLRYRTRSGWVTKNDKLAAVEVDDNFIAMEEDLANTTDPAKGATLLGFEGNTVREELLRLAIPIDRFADLVACIVTGKQIGRAHV